MSAFRKYILPIAIGLTVFAVSRYFFPPVPLTETSQMDCAFTASERTGPATIPYSQDTFSKIEYEASLAGKSVHEGGVLWHGKGTASFEGGSQQLAGAVFVNADNEVRGHGLYRDRYPHEANDVSISTLNGMVISTGMKVLRLSISRMRRTKWLMPLITNALSPTAKVNNAQTY